jgi:hypothetical protein
MGESLLVRAHQQETDPFVLDELGRALARCRDRAINNGGPATAEQPI